MTRTLRVPGRAGFAALALLALGCMLCGCGGIQDLNPLTGGLGGSTDHAAFNFEAGTDGWACQSSSGSSGCVSVSQDMGQSFAGKGSLRVLMDMTPANSVSVGATYASSYPNLNGVTVTAWIYAPAGTSPNTSDPSYAQIYVQDVDGNYANGAGANLNPGQWTEVSFMPFTNNTGAIYQANSVYEQSPFDATQIGTIGVKFAASGSAPANFSYNGYVLIDSMNW